MSDLILSLPHYQTYSDLRSADNRHDFRPYVTFTGFAFYIAVRCCFDKHLYLTSCLNAHNHKTCICLPQTDCTTRKMALFITSQDRQNTSDKYLPLIPNARYINKKLEYVISSFKWCHMIDTSM